MEKLTIIILTLNEEDFIEGAIESASFADEIIIIDSFSTDKTAELVKSHDVVFIQHPFENFSKQRLIAANQAKNNMILFLDADERIQNSLKEEILALLKQREHCSAYKILFSHIFMGCHLKHSSLNNLKIRLFDKRKCWYEEKLLVHEKIIVKMGAVGHLKNPIKHYTYRSWNHFIEKKHHYAQLQALQLYRKGVKPNFFHFVIKPSFRFFNQFLFRGGFLDGFPGFANAVGNAYGVLERYIKLRLLYDNKK